MREHKGKRLCITGMATAGKSTLTRKLAEETGGIGLLLDDFRQSLSSDERYRKWVNFYSDQDLETYYTTTNPEAEWINFTAQSEALWPAFLELMDSYAQESRPVIFECVSLMPHLIRRDTDFPCIVLIGTSYEETLERNKKAPRWGSTERELELNSKSFFYVERPRFIEEAQKFNCPLFQTSDDAFQASLDLLK